MDYSVFEIAGGINLTCFPGSSGKSFISVNVLSQLSRDTAALNAALPFVLMKGSFSCPDSSALNAAMSAAGGMSIIPFSKKYGEIQSIGFRSFFPEEFRKTAVQLVCELLSKPATRGGLLLPDYVSSVCEELADRILDRDESILHRCIREMCVYEEYSVSRRGEPEELSGINYKKLSKHYKSLIQTAPIEIVYIGSADPLKLANELKRSLSTLARTETDYEMGTDIRLNSVEDTPRHQNGSSFNGIERAALGYRFGERFYDYDYTVFQTMLKLAGILSAAPGSGFGTPVFYTDGIKGLFAVCSAPCESNGQSFEEFFASVLDRIAQQNFTADEFALAVKQLEEFYSALASDPAALCAFILCTVIAGKEPDIDGALECLQTVTPADVAAAAAGVVPDMVYTETADN